MHNCGSKLTSCGPSITDQATASQRVMMQLQKSLQNIAEATQANASCALLTHLLAMTDYSIGHLSLCIEHGIEVQVSRGGPFFAASAAAFSASIPATISSTSASSSNRKPSS